MKFIKPITVTDAKLTSSTVPETDYAAYNAGTTYALGNRVIRTSTHRIYESVQNGNTGNTPESSPTWWLDVSPTNKWAMFDTSVGSVTSDGTPIVVEITPGEAIDSIALLDVGGSTTIEVLVENGATTVFSETYDMSDDAVLLDWYMYFFEAIEVKEQLIVQNIPPYSGAVITITINADTTAQCGTLVLGSMKPLGCTRYGASVSIIDYSIKETDAFGITTVTERTYAKRLEAQIELKNTAIDYVTKALTGIRALPVVWIADNDTGMADSLILYGFYKDWSIDIAYFEDSIGSLVVESLT